MSLVCQLSGHGVGKSIVEHQRLLDSEGPGRFFGRELVVAGKTNADFRSLAFGLGILRAYQHVEFKMSSWDVSQFFLPTNMIGVV
jgi:hypothetical protein